MSETNTISKNKELIELGTFEMVSGVARISDPCYDRKTWCSGKLDNVKNGTWKTQVIKKTETYTYNSNEDWCKGKTFTDHRNVLIAVHESFDKSIHTDKRNVDKLINGGMDAGMAGIFDDQFYKKNYKEDYIKFGEKEYNDAQRDWRRKENNIEKLLTEVRGAVYKEPTKEEQEASDIRVTLAVLKSQIVSLPASIEENKKKKGFEEFAKRDARYLKEMKQRLARYKANPIPENLIERTRDWYEICCDKSLSNIGAGVIKNGVVCSSGYGDGGYTTLAVYDANGQVVGIKLIF